MASPDPGFAPRTELLDWTNGLLKLQLTKVEQVRGGRRRRAAAAAARAPAAQERGGGLPAPVKLVLRGAGIAGLLTSRFSAAGLHGPVRFAVAPVAAPHPRPAIPLPTSPPPRSMPVARCSASCWTRTTMTSSTSQRCACAQHPAPHAAPAARARGGGRRDISRASRDTAPRVPRTADACACHPAACTLR